jgi:hypothetical protein
METISIHTSVYTGDPETLEGVMKVLCEIALKAFDGGYTGNVKLVSVEKGEFSFEGSLYPLGSSVFDDQKVTVQIEGTLDAFYINLEVTVGKGKSQVKHTLACTTLDSRPLTLLADFAPADSAGKKL